MQEQGTPTQVAPALKELLERFIDYAGIFPPAALTIDVALANFAEYEAGVHAWMLRWFVVGEAELAKIPSRLDGRLSLLGQVDNDRAAVIETKATISAQRPVYCEVAVDKLSELAAVKAAGCFAKIRTGGVVETAIPSTRQVADFIIACAEQKLAFKATAGLHHAVRGTYALTYAADSPKATMHGFLNVFVAAAFAWHGQCDIEPILSETASAAFSFGENLKWRDKSLTAAQINEARRDFIHSMGSCSFSEPVDELKSHGLLQ